MKIQLLEGLSGGCFVGGDSSIGGGGFFVIVVILGGFFETRSHYVILTGFKLRDLPVSASSVVPLKL